MFTYDSQFDIQRKDPSFWRWSAQKLARAAEFVLAPCQEQWTQIRAQGAQYIDAHPFSPDGSLYEVYYLLMGLAIENALKAILIKTCAADDVIAIGHRLERLAAKAEVVLTDEERQHLDDLQPYINWKGRYPTPKELKDWKLSVGHDGLMRSPARLGANQDQIDRTLALYQKLFRLGAKTAATPSKA